MILTKWNWFRSSNFQILILFYSEKYYNSNTVHFLPSRSSCRKGTLICRFCFDLSNPLLISCQRSAVSVICSKSIFQCCHFWSFATKLVVFRVFRSQDFLSGRFGRFGRFGVTFVILVVLGLFGNFREISTSWQNSTLITFIFYVLIIFQCL